MKRSSILILVLSMVFVLSLTVGAFAQVNNPTTFTKVNMGTIDSLDPHYQYDNASSEIYANIYENLIMFDDGDVTQYEPMLATKVPTLDNGIVKDNQTTYVFPIREGVKFHEGGTLTPEDVKYSFMRGLIHDRNGGPWWMLYGPLFDAGGLSDITEQVVGVENPSELTAAQSAEVYAELDKAISVDGNKVVFNLPKPNPTFLSVVVHDNGLGAIIDKEWSIEQGAWDGSPETIAEYYDPAKESDPLYDKMMGTGPFVLTEWENGDHVYLKRNDNYWREPANFKTVVFKNIDEFSTRKLLLQRGDADMIYVPNQFLSQVKQMDNVTVTKGIPAQQNLSGIMNWEIAIKGNDSVGSGQLDGKGIPSKFFADKDVRMGFINAFNFKAFIEDVRLGN